MFKCLGYLVNLSLTYQNHTCRVGLPLKMTHFYIRRYYKSTIYLEYKCYFLSCIALIIVNVVWHLWLYVCCKTMQDTNAIGKTKPLQYFINRRYLRLHTIAFSIKRRLGWDKSFLFLQWKYRIDNTIITSKKSSSYS